MANEEQLELIKQGVGAWNKWRDAHRDVQPDLGRADLRMAHLSGANLYRANLVKADLSEANLSGADLQAAYLTEATLARANLAEADLALANLALANLTEADLSRADLTGANLVEAHLEKANLNGCRIYGISAWNISVNQETNQSDLIITKQDETTVSVDNLEVAQFIYLLLNNQKIRQVIDTITSKVVLILGRFTKKRKHVLDAIREELRKHDYIPVLFDFKKPKSKDVTGTVETLARMARFIIADLTDPSSIPYELGTIVPFLRTTPVLTIKVVGSKGFSMFEDLRRSYNWVLDTYEYADGDALISTLPKVIAPADSMAEELRRTR